MPVIDTNYITLEAVLDGSKDYRIQAQLQPVNTITAEVTIPRVVGNIYPDYTGEYEVIPRFEEQSLPTMDTVLHADVLVKEIPMAEVTNPSGGYTVTIG